MFAAADRRAVIPLLLGTEREPSFCQQITHSAAERLVGSGLDTIMNSSWLSPVAAEAGHFGGDMNPRPSGEPRSPFSFARDAATPDQADQSTDRAEREGESSSPSVRPESILDAKASFEGRLRAEQDLRIQGSIAGTIVCRGLLTIEATASARAQIETHDLDVYGLVEGDIFCTGRLRLGATAVVSGSVKTGTLLVEAGASINGAVEANYTGEAGITAQSPRRATDADDAVAGGRRARTRDLPTFAVVQSVDSEAESGLGT